jgi:PKD repeat protein
MTATHRPLWAVAAIATVALVAFGGLLGAHPAAQPSSADRGAAPFAPMATASALPSGATWTHLPSVNGAVPPLRTGATAAFDSWDGYYVLFGGCGRVCPLGDTWVYLHGAWTNLTANLTTAPPARSGASMVYDPSNLGVVLFGGKTASGLASDTWVFRTGQWHELATANSYAPPARFGAAFAADLRDHEDVLFGGTNANGTVLGDTWILSNGAWQSLATQSAPAPRTGAVSAFYPAPRYVLLFGGQGGAGQSLADSWSFYGGAWQPISAAGSSQPAGRASATLNLDPFYNALMLVGGAANGTVMSDTWLFNEGVWENLTSVIGRSPTPRSGAASAYDLVDGYTLVFGGSVGTTLASASWIFVHPLTAQITATPTTVAPGATVTFGAYAQGGIMPYRYIWHFGDQSAPGNSTGATHAYATAGTYRAQLTVLDARNAQLISYTSITVAYPPLVLQLTAVPSPIVATDNATFVATTFGGAGTLVFAWTGLPPSCGAPTTSNVSCRFATPGSFTVSVTASDVHGDSASASTHLLVTALTTASLTAVPPSAAVQTFDRFGWILVPPLAGATIMAALSAWVTYLAWKRAKLHPSGPQLLCYMPAEWKETPDDFQPPTA